MAMQTMAKIGIAVASIGIATWVIPIIRYDYPTHVPVHSSFPLNAGSVFTEEFKVRTAEKYSLNLGWRPVPLEFLTTLGSASNLIPCDMTVQLWLHHELIQSNSLRQLRPSSYCNGTGFWHLAYFELPSAGRYTLEIANKGGLNEVHAVAPAVTMDVGGFFYENAIFSKLFGWLVGGPILLIGIALFAVGRRSRQKITSGDVP
jgi:hypothetical protein